MWSMCVRVCVGVRMSAQISWHTSEARKLFVGIRRAHVKVVSMLRAVNAMITMWARWWVNAQSAQACSFTRVCVECAFDFDHSRQYCQWWLPAPLEWRTQCELPRALSRQKVRIYHAAMARCVNGSGSLHTKNTQQLLMSCCCCSCCC